MAALQDSDPSQVGGYRLLERLAIGGMGIVYLGESPSGRKVAVKFMKDGALCGDAELEGGEVSSPAIHDHLKALGI